MCSTKSGVDCYLQRLATGSIGSGTLAHVVLRRSLDSMVVLPCLDTTPPITSRVPNSTSPGKRVVPIYSPFRSGVHRSYQPCCLLTRQGNKFGILKIENGVSSGLYSLNVTVTWKCEQLFHAKLGDDHSGTEAETGTYLYPIASVMSYSACVAFRSVGGCLQHVTDGCLKNFP
ncbi:hypothetical protein M404DRAFT_307993 [Pisolithus tinctorius Marx 270]|uniref:Uncharacterized protein n=1 Tax=Pisolithus tinctorius Marx 270 TaxID=870435 RepID=A0A0C3P6Y5_PISTI|nr:hypothetical protein M404DRAFT_307993 [Pisolithus tinctorius Marx 270]